MVLVLEGAHATSDADGSGSAVTALECRSVVESYPDSILRKLFSSVPTREFAVEDVTLTFGDARTRPCAATGGGRWSAKTTMMSRI